jgi:nicotinic acid phosphoribosyltransferase
MQTITISKTYNKEEAFERFVELYKKDKNSIYDKDSEAREL